MHFSLQGYLYVIFGCFSPSAIQFQLLFLWFPPDTHSLVPFFSLPASSLNVTGLKHLSEECGDHCFQSSLHCTESAFAFWKRKKIAVLLWSRIFICKPYAIFGVSDMKASCVKLIKKKITGDLEQWLRSQQASLHDTYVIKIVLFGIPKWDFLFP